ncbi:ribonuclease G [Marichromatium gracile]|uniref:Ribonuclease G n=1 Tax=Marichromatium gracile TaxID=1048 RepID=A0A4R4A7A6_MARGR|nr:MULTISPECIES: ribonuclease G [Marichromatium]MBO8087100.1 ribonuclease G [Marichromatium sp.]MBK1710011.1 ribonuclease E/G [Marichromatium gracile]MCF1184969.1 ribonuclease G [Marichromatium gracile]RNE90653.1 ribonuclease G [Marichromatium sp. AB31]RNE92808.1 ribonuclease G [Marichromatium sp. AB32]
MSEEILINVTPPETRVAVVENGVVQEIIIERAERCGLVGNVYKGRVCRVLPGMQAAFVEIGLERAAFLHASDIIGPHGEPLSEHIQDLVVEGDPIVVQVVKDPLGTKGARLTTNISVASRYLVCMPALGGIGVSQKIDDEDERRRLRDILQAFVDDHDGQGGFIARTAAEGVDEHLLVRDMGFLDRLWRGVKERCANASGDGLIHEDLPLALRALRDLVTPDVERVRIDSRAMVDKAIPFAAKYIPEIKDRIDLYQGERPLFDLYGVEDEIRKALHRKVSLKSGGHLVIDQTEAMTTIDVNTGAFVGHRNLEETIFKTNLEAAQAICRQLRLRNLGGIIIIDFIDMTEDEHKRQVLRALEKCLARDHAKTHITEVSSLGLVEMTRKRTRESLEHVLCEPCPCCGGRGSIKTAETTCYEIFREIMRESRQFDVESLLVLASQEVVDRLLDEESAHLAELEEFIGRPIRLQAEALYTQEQYDVVLI